MPQEHLQEEKRAARNAAKHSMRGGGLSTLTTSVVVIGAVCALAFGVWWFREISGHCGVVRFYENLFGQALIGGWLTGTGLGLGVVRFGKNNGAPKIRIAGTALSVAASVTLALVAALTAHAVVVDKLTFKSNQQLLEMMNDPGISWKPVKVLGERRAVEAAPALAALLENLDVDANLRCVAAVALGNICAEPALPGTDLDQAVNALVGALENDSTFLSSYIIQALGKIRNPQSIGPLTVIAGDASRSTYARCDAVRALGAINSPEAIVALETLTEACNDETLRSAVTHALFTMNKRTDGKKQ